MKQIFCFMKYVNISVLIFSMSIWSIPAHTKSLGKYIGPPQRGYYTSVYGTGMQPGRQACTEKKILKDTRKAYTKNANEKRKKAIKDFHNITKKLKKYLKPDAVDDIAKSKKEGAGSINYNLCNSDSENLKRANSNIKKATKALKKAQNISRMSEDNLLSATEQKDKELEIAEQESEKFAEAITLDQEGLKKEADLAKQELISKRVDYLACSNQATEADQDSCKRQINRDIARLKRKIKGLNKKKSRKTNLNNHSLKNAENKIKSIDKELDALANPKGQLEVAKNNFKVAEDAKKAITGQDSSGKAYAGSRPSKAMCALKNGGSESCFSKTATTAFDEVISDEDDDSSSSKGVSGFFSNLFNNSSDCDQGNNYYSYDENGGNNHSSSNCSSSSNSSTNSDECEPISGKEDLKHSCSYQGLWGKKFEKAKNNTAKQKKAVENCSELIAKLDILGDKITNLENYKESISNSTNEELVEAIEADCEGCSLYAGSGGGSSPGVIYYGPSGKATVQKESTSPWLKIGAGLLGAWGGAKLFGSLGDKSAQYAVDSNESLGYETDASALSGQSSLLGIQGALMGYSLVNSAFSNESSNGSSGNPGAGYYYRGYYNQGGYGSLGRSAGYSGSYGCAQSVGGFQIQQGGNFWSNGGPGSGAYGQPIVGGPFGYPPQVFGPMGGSPFQMGINPYGQMINGGAGQYYFNGNPGFGGNQGFNGMFGGNPGFGNAFNGNFGFNNGFNGNQGFNNGFNGNQGFNSNLSYQYQMELAQRYQQNANAWIQQQQSINQQKQQRGQQISSVQQQIYQLQLEMQQIANAPFNTGNGGWNSSGGWNNNNWGNDAIIPPIPLSQECGTYASNYRSCDQNNRDKGNRGDSGSSGGGSNSSGGRNSHR